MKKILLLTLLGCATLSAQDLPEKYAAYGQVLFVPFASAPFPHPLREKGHQYGTNFFSAAEHYSDSHVVLFVPKNFHDSGKTDFVVHFHGWRNTLTNVLPKYRMIEQFAASKRNAILIVPQGPVNASDSFGGKMEDPGGFERFMEEAAQTLHERGIIKNETIGKIVLSTHSGGYGAVSSILSWGGLSSHIREVWLFDSLYARTEWFAIWFDHHKSRFIDLYTEHGGTKENSLDLMAALKNNDVPFYRGDETNATPRDLRGNHLLFLFDELPHDEVMQSRHTFQNFLETSALDAIRD